MSSVQCSSDPFPRHLKVCFCCTYTDFHIRMPCSKTNWVQCIQRKSHTKRKTSYWLWANEHTYHTASTMLWMVWAFHLATGTSFISFFFSRSIFDVVCIVHVHVCIVNASWMMCVGGSCALVCVVGYVQNSKNEPHSHVQILTHTWIIFRLVVFAKRKLHLIVIFCLFNKLTTGRQQFVLCHEFCHWVVCVCAVCTVQCRQV